MLRLSLFALGMLTAATAASAETRTFVVANAPDAYGVDQCLASGARCGELVANAFCQSKEFEQAASFRRIEPSDVTASTPTPAASSGKDFFVAIECRR
jgi:hypothetical protein